jgi:hypothetical protein
MIFQVGNSTQMPDINSTEIGKKYSAYMLIRILFLYFGLGQAGEGGHMTQI